MSDKRPIGVFDSGLGGLTVLAQLIKELPLESTVYLGDTARLPYGTKSGATVLAYARANVKYLLENHDAKMVVIACNTASAFALEPLQEEFDIPIVGVIAPVADALCDQDKKSLLILATQGTVRSEAYKNALRGAGFRGEISHKACPLFVSLVEEGMLEGEIAQSIVKHYLGTTGVGFDSVVLGCTHFPLLSPIIQNQMGDNVTLFESGLYTAKKVRRVLEESEILNHSPITDARRRYLVSDESVAFANVFKKLLGSENMCVLEKVDILI